MAITIERNGKEFSFPDNYTQEQIDKFFQDMENPVPVPEENVEAEGEEEKRGILTDVPIQAYGGVVKATKSAVKLIEDLGQDAKRQLVLVDLLLVIMLKMVLFNTILMMM